MKLKKLFKDIPVTFYKGKKEIEITGLCSHSKMVSPGNLFIAKQVYSENGADYIEEAISSGAIAILCDTPNPFLDVTQIISSNIADIESLIAARYYSFPSRELFLVGITGTNGKTTTAYLIKHLLDSLELPCGLIGTIEYLTKKTQYKATHTTPDVVSNNKLLKEMVKDGCKAAVMEVSSHALEQKRVELIDFDVAIFTNLTQDHLDYHRSMENYASSKKKLFKNLNKDKVAIVNCDSCWHQLMIEKTEAKIITYSIDNQADINAYNIKMTPHGTESSVSYQNKKIDFSWTLVGRYNVYNALAAIGVCLSQGIKLENLPTYFASFKSVSGRLERVINDRNLNIFVDYAHTEDALENVLKCLHEIKKGKIFTVFGCGGNRDKGKRPKMAAVSEKYSDMTIVTTDNPRTEDPLTICQEILAGFNNANHCLKLDRRVAIQHAIELATPEDIVLIAGKGHETYQLFSHKTIEFDDRKVAEEFASATLKV